MRFFGFEDERMDIVATNAMSVRTGREYLITDGIERGEYRGVNNTYFSEIVEPGSRVSLMTKKDGGKPFAVATNDSDRDEFEPFHLSRILVEDGNYVVYSFKDKEDPEHSPVRFIIMEVINKQPIDDLVRVTMQVRIVYQFTAIDRIPDPFGNVVNHAIEVFAAQVSDQLIPKYCFNPNRQITLRLFQRNQNNELVSYLDDGKKIILNSNSFERHKDSDKREVVETALIRVFYSKKFKDSKLIFVEGKTLVPLRRYELAEYIRQSHLEESVAQITIKEIVTQYGSFFAITNLNGDIRPIYKSSNGYSSFALNMREMDYITEVRDVTEWV
jgi:hypothetical protein